VNAIVTAIAALAALGGALGGALLGAWLTGRQQQTERRAAFLEHQLRDFYSPLVSLHEQILAKTRMREKVLRTAQEDPRVKGSQKDLLMQHDADHFVEELFPDYQSMLRIFRDNLWLAQAETRSYFPALFEFVEIWNRWLKETLPAEMVHIIGHNEEPLHPFYEHLRRKHDELQARLSKGKA
jgi:hypothetical protein